MDTSYQVECLVKKSRTSHESFAVTLTVRTENEADITDIARREVAKSGFLFVRIIKYIESQTVSF